MCFLLLAINKSSNYPIILAANRDEYYQRNTSTLKFWDDKPHILGGRDLEQGGTWMAVSKSGKFAAITNFREAKCTQIPQRSRGLLITDYLGTDITTKQFTKQLEKQADQYDGFNLIFGEMTNTLFYYSNRNDQRSQPLESGIYALSNHLLNTPWPKAIQGKSNFENIISFSSESMQTSLFQLLNNSQKAKQDQIPDTGIDKNFEHLLSSIYIESETYGTRCSSVLMLDVKNNLSFTELTHKANPEPKENPIKYSLQL